MIGEGGGYYLPPNRLIKFDILFSRFIYVIMINVIVQTGGRVESILEVEEDEDINVIVPTGVRVESILEVEEDEDSSML